MQMILATTNESPASLIAVECGFMVIAVAVSLVWPTLGFRLLSRIGHAFERMARRRAVSVLFVGSFAFSLRLAILAWCPIPLPFLPDDFSHLLAADTFAHGRLTNPTPAMWIHFESIHIDMKPTYMSMYFPAQGLVLAAGKVLFGQPWFGLLIASSLMCAAICWMLQGWLPPAWALLGGFLSVLRLGLFSYWVNTFTGGGPIAALGGALLLGGLPRFMKYVRTRDALFMAIGVVLMANTRPYEGILLCLPVSAALAHWFFCAKHRPSAAVLFRRVAPAVALCVAAAVSMGYYDSRVFGNPLTLPYTINRATYAVAPYFIWQSQRPVPVYHHEEIRRLYNSEELTNYNFIHSFHGFLLGTFLKAALAIRFFAGLALLPPLLMLRRVFLDRRIRFLVVCLPVLVVGMAIQVFFIPHYVAPFTAIFYAIGLQAMRHLRHWSLGGQLSGVLFVRLIVTVCIVMAVFRMFARPLHMEPARSEVTAWMSEWYGPGHYGTERADIERRLEHLPGEQLVLVRYAPRHDPGDEWVYNAADIDSSKVIWAREMDPIANLELFQYYKTRNIWLVQPDQPEKLSSYPLTSSAAPPHTNENEN